MLIVDMYQYRIKYNVLLRLRKRMLSLFRKIFLLLYISDIKTSIKVTMHCPREHGNEVEPAEPTPASPT